ncbi:hypothetical protein M1V18_004404 [Salmonella enterica]|nr:hypothetical protein [Salmonella enterica]
MITINTRQFAELIGVSEGELIYALDHTGALFGVVLPKPAYARHKSLSRKFEYAAAIEFAKKITDSKGKV